MRAAAPGASAAARGSSSTTACGGTGCSSPARSPALACGRGRSTAARRARPTMSRSRERRDERATRDGERARGRKRGSDPDPHRERRRLRRSPDASAAKSVRDDLRERPDHNGMRRSTIYGLDNDAEIRSWWLKSTSCGRWRVGERRRRRADMMDASTRAARIARPAEPHGRPGSTSWRSRPPTTFATCSASRRCPTSAPACCCLGAGPRLLMPSLNAEQAAGEPRDRARDLGDDAGPERALRRRSRRRRREVGRAWRPTPRCGPASPVAAEPLPGARS